MDRAVLTRLDQAQDRFAGRTFEQANVITLRERLDAHRDPLAIALTALRHRMHHKVSRARRPPPYGSRKREGLIFGAVRARTGRHRLRSAASNLYPLAVLCNGETQKQTDRGVSW